MSATATANDPIRKHLLTARKQIAKGELQEAAKSLGEAQAIWPNDARIFILAGQMAEKSGNVKGAFEALQRAVALDPKWGAAEFELALLHSRQQQHDEALRLAQRVATREPNNLVVMAGFVDIAHAAGNLEIAIRELRRGLQIVPGDSHLRRTLARDLNTAGERNEALEIWNALIELDPKDEQAVFGRALTYIEAGKPSLAVRDTNTLIEMFPGNSGYAYYSAIANGVTPSQQPPEFSRRMFDDMAPNYDQHMVRGLKYMLPKIVADKILKRFPTKALSVLDLGCGTGLLGVCLGRLDGFLIGVDVSQGMIAQAGRHGLYDRFHTVNLHDALRETPGSIYEVITALDLFIYTGDLSETIPNAHRILLPAGDLYFSCETAAEDGPDLALQTNGRYAHKRSHVLELCKQAGFESVEIEDLVLRHEGGEAVNGFLVTAHKAA